MSKTVHRWTPYSYKGRVALILLLCCLIAAPLSFLCAYGISRYNARDELSEAEHDAAIYLLELEQKTDLSLDDMLLMAAGSNLTVTAIDPENAHLTEQQLRDLSTRLTITEVSGITELPVTYVYLDNTIVRIRAGAGYNLFFAASVRVFFAIGSFLLFFTLAGNFAAEQISKPISKLTKATQRVAQGDFTLRLPETLGGELGALTRSFNGMTEALSRTEYLQKDFITSVSHEFKTPIASIRGFARMLQMPELPEEKRREYIELIAQESDRLSRLSSTLLRLSSLEQQSAPAAVTPFSLDEQLRQVILRLEPAWSQKEIDWQLELSEVTVTSDPELIQQVWINLIQNAIKFSHQGGEIAVRLYCTDCAVVELEDHGVGMTEEVTARIFDRFYQAEGSRSHEGVGLGLCLVKRILDMLGGSVRVRSAPDKGSQFTVRLPIEPDRHSAKEDAHGH